jgi:gamma-glutamylcyclotransferase (GGCT)/AIG2-like uncharacterized protein YtfP
MVSAQLNTETGGWKKEGALLLGRRMKMHRIMVYGTLMRAEANYHIMERGMFLGTGTTPGSIFGYGFAPGAVSPEHKAHRKGSLIHGELFEVNDTTLRILERLEGVEYGNYTRTPVEVVLDKTGEILDAEIYFHNRYREYGEYFPGRWEPKVF